MLNPLYPAPNRARMEVCYRVYGSIMRALANVVPDRVIAGGFDSTVSFSLSHMQRGKFQVSMEVFGGGYGASSDGPGCDGCDSPLSNCANTPVESLDIEYPYFMVTEYSLYDSSGGNGAHRGGLGFVRRYEITKDEVSFVFYADRFKFAPQGLHGGSPGKVGELEVTQRGVTRMYPGKFTGILNKGDTICLRTGGGAGYGQPVRNS